jgi:hypothetical protein
MGLDIYVGYLARINREEGEGAGDWLREDFEAINAALADEGLPLHHEPEELPPLHTRGSYEGFPYSFLHYLRRFYAHVVTNPGQVPEPVAAGELGDDPVLEELMEEAFDTQAAPHLLFHSDTNGYYVPVDFRPVLMDPQLPGNALGSSYRLLEELRRVAGPLGISLVKGHLHNDEAAKLRAEVEKGPFWIERLVWFSLFERARLSVEHGTAICFR